MTAGSSSWPGQSGIKGIGELFTVDTNHDLDALTRVARAAGINIIGSTGWFFGQHLPPLVHAGDVGRLAAIMEHEVLVGTAMTGARAGVIGEIGWSARHGAPRGAQGLRGGRHGPQANRGPHLHPHDRRHPGLGGGRLPDRARGAGPRRIAVSHMDTKPGPGTTTWPWPSGEPI